MIRTPAHTAHPCTIHLCGGVFMCRKNQLQGWAVIAFGIGLLIGTRIGGGFLVGCLGVGIIFFGFSLLLKR